MSVARTRLLLLGLVCVLGATIWWVTQPKLDGEPARAAVAEAAQGDAVRAAALPYDAVPISRRHVILCLRSQGFDVHSAPAETLLVDGRGLPETQVRVLGIGAADLAPDGWGVTAQAAFLMPSFEDRAVRKAFFDCIDPRVPAGS